MPIHDWTRVSAGTWHDFHTAWISEIRNSMNAGLLPGEYYAQAEQIAGPLGPDVLVPEATSPPGSNSLSYSEDAGSGGVAVATRPPRAKLVGEAEMNDYVLKRRTVVIRHASDDRIVALLEIVSPGNKSGRTALKSFVEKAVETLYRGYHLTVIDLFPPTRRDPNGIHAEIWAELTDDEFLLPPETPRTLASYSAGFRKKAYVEPTAVGSPLLDMPIFLDEETYVDVPLETTYEAAYRGVPRKWKAVLE